MLEKAFFDHEVFISSYLPEDFSLTTLSNYKTQLGKIAAHIEDNTQPIRIEDQNTDIRELLCNVWYQVVTNKQLKTDFTNVFNQAAAAADGNEYDLKV